MKEGDIIIGEGMNEKRRYNNWWRMNERNIIMLKEWMKGDNNWWRNERGNIIIAEGMNERGDIIIDEGMNEEEI